MTLSELLKSVDRTKLFNCLRSKYARMQSEKCKTCYNETYELLSSIQPGENDGANIEIDFCDRFWHEQGIEAWLNFDRDIPTVLSREVVVCKDVPPLSNEVIAAMCLWRVAFLMCKDVSEAY